MTVETLCGKLQLKNWTPEAEVESEAKVRLSAEITGGYVGDMLSWVMGRAKPGCAWITIMSNQNVAAVAAMADVACVILAENVAPDDTLLKHAKERGIVLLGSSLPSYELAVGLGRLLGT